MIAIKPYAKVLDITTGVNVLKKIEWIGRTCYKSTDKITDGSAERFVSGLIKRGHEAMLEHASFCFEVDDDIFNDILANDRYFERVIKGYKSFLRNTNVERNLISGNVRAWRNFFKAFVENYGYLHGYAEKFIHDNPVLFPEFQDCIFRDFFENIIRPVMVEDIQDELEILKHVDFTVLWVVDRGISHELVRHRPASFAQESTRYCNYSKDQFGGQITFIIPEFFEYGTPAWKVWKNSMERCEADYITLINMGVSPEKARTVLSSSLKTEVIMTANCEEWRHFFKLRACNVTGKAHPQMLEVAQPLLDEFKNIVTVIFDDLAYGE